MGFEIVGRVFDAEAFKEYIETVNLNWISSVTVHHTASPNLAQRPKGWTIQHMRNIADYYKNGLGWSSGPHLFTDEDQIFGMSSLWKPGVHARSFNRNSIGIETLGDYDNEDPKSGRGLECWHTTAQATAIILEKRGLEPSNSTVKFHRNDPQTSKTCPGRLVEKDWFLGLVSNYTNSTGSQDLTLEQRVERLERLNGV